MHNSQTLIILNGGENPSNIRFAGLQGDVVEISPLLRCYSAWVDDWLPKFPNNLQIQSANTSIKQSDSEELKYPRVSTNKDILYC